MNRLTNSIDYCKFHCDFGKEKDCLFKDKSKCYEKNIYEKLREYEDAEEQGLLLRLPCKVGDTVYFVDFDENEYDEAIVESIEFGRNGFLINSDCEIGTCLGAEKYHIDEKVVDGMNAAIRAIENEIKEQPTAYDVDKVVEELACNSRFIDDINEHNIKCISCVVGQKTAIDIVRKGGIDD